MNIKFKNYILLFLVIYLSFASCKKKTSIERELDLLDIKTAEYIKIDTVFYKSKKIKSLRFYKEKGEYVNVSFYESERKKTIGYVKNNQCHNEYTDWYENGKIKWTRKYNLGNQIGKNIQFREDGTMEQSYDNDSDESIVYWENGEINFKFKPNESSSYHYLNGNYIEKYTNKLKDEYEVEYFNENGKLVFKGLYKKKILFKENLKYSGEIICYFNNGKTSLYQNVVNGIPNGKFYSSYGNGKLKYESEVINGKEIYYKAYHKNGKLDFIRDGVNNKFTQWDENGKIIE